MRKTQLFRIGSITLSAAVALGLVLLMSTRATHGQQDPRKNGQPSGMRPTVTAQQRARWFQPGPPWDGRGRGPMTQAQIDTFTDYPLLWLGESFVGYNLVAVQRTGYKPPTGIPRTTRGTR